MIKLKTLLLKFAGPLQSWGTNSDFETRHTDLYPSKSAVIGMIAGSLGYRRYEDGKINQLKCLDFAVRIDQPGNLLRDFHTGKRYTTDDTYTTNRYYIEDGVFVVAVGSEDEKIIKSILTAIQKPYFQQYMGRRALPVNSDFILGMIDGDVLSSLRKCVWQASKWYQKENKEITELYMYADSKLLPTKRKMIRHDEVVSFNQKARNFDYRYESMGKISLKKGQTEEHDVFSVLGD